jgi:hypothetical protein
MTTKHLALAPEIRFERFIEKIPFSECWIWTGQTMNSGYGNFGIAKHVSDGAHRYSYRIYKGEIPEGLFVCHTCNEKLCVNPRHLYAATCLQNTRDAQRDNLLAKQLNPEKVLTIRRLRKEGWKQKAIAREVGCGKSMIQFVLSGHSWSHIQ